MRADGYEALGDSLEEGKAAGAAKEQAAQEDAYERMLMDVYNALYKVQAWQCSCEAPRSV